MSTPDIKLLCSEVFWDKKWIGRTKRDQDQERQRAIDRAHWSLKSSIAVVVLRVLMKVTKIPASELLFGLHWVVSSRGDDDSLTLKRGRLTLTDWPLMLHVQVRKMQSVYTLFTRILDTFMFSLNMSLEITTLCKMRITPITRILDVLMLMFRSVVYQHMRSLCINCSTFWTLSRLCIIW